MVKPLISIVIATFNRAHLISDTIKSIRSQTYPNWECIVIDDGSDDETESIINSFIKIDKRIKFFHRPIVSRKGPSSCRNFGKSISKGDFINFFDSDDIMLPFFLERRLNHFMIAPNLNVVFSSFGYFNNQLIQKRSSNQFFNGDLIEEGFIKRDIVFGNSFLLKREFVSENWFDEYLERSIDLDFYFRLFSSNRQVKVSYVPDVLYLVRKHTGNISSTDNINYERLKSSIKVHGRIFQHFHKLHNNRGVDSYRNECLVDLQRILKVNSYSLAINRIIFLPFSIVDKCRLLMYVLIHSILGRGEYRVKNLRRLI